MVSYLPVTLLVLGLLVLVFTGIRLFLAWHRFVRTRVWLTNYVTDRGGLLRARSAALRVGFARLRQHGSVAEGPRSIDGSLRREVHSA